MRYITNEKVFVWAYDKYDERKDLSLSGTLAECESTAKKYGYVVFEIYHGNEQAKFDHEKKAWFID